MIFKKYDFHYTALVVYHFCLCSSWQWEDWDSSSNLRLL